MGNGLDGESFTIFGGATETVAGYVMHPTPTLANSDWVLQAGGDIDTGAVRITGGWNRVDMSTQTSETWLSGQRTISQGLNLNDKSGVKVDTIGLVGYVTNAVVYGTSTSPSKNHVVSLVGIVDCGGTDAMANLDGLKHNCFIAGNNGTGRTRVTAKFINACAYHIIGQNLMNCIAVHEYNFGRVLNVQSTTHAAFASGYAGLDKRLNVGAIINTESATESYSDAQAFRLSNCTYQTVTNASSGPSSSVKGYFENCSVLVTPREDCSHCLFHYTNAGGNPDLYGYANTGSTNIQTSTNTRSGEGVSLFSPFSSWRNRVNTPTGVTYLHGAPLCKIAVVANKQVTVNAWVKTYFQHNNVYLFTSAFDGFPGLGQNISTPLTGSEDWEQTTLTFTPTATGLVQIYFIPDWGEVYIGGAAYFDDFYIDQVTYSIAP
jgi:hypothetical protein